jgi:hypothetical protein
MTEASPATPARRQRTMLWLALVCGPYGAFCVAVYWVNHSKQPGSDWMVYYTAARAWLDGNLGLLADGERLTAYLNASFGEWLARPLTYHAWVYPPHYLLILIPFAVLPFALSGIAFLAITFGCLAAAIWRFAEPGYPRGVHLFSLLFAPAASFTVATGQNAFLTTALLVGGFGALPQHPVLAGMLLGVLTYKPQFWLMVPVALVAARQWCALAATFTSAATMVAASLIVVGAEPWHAWIGWAISPPDPAYRTWLATARLHGESVYANLIVLGASHAAASAGQAIAVLLAASIVWRCCRRPIPRDRQLIVLLGATALAAPHVANYDAVLLVIAATLLVVRGLADGFRRGELIVPVLVWMIQLFNPPSWFHVAVVTPLLTTLLIAYAVSGTRLATPDASANLRHSAMA